MKQLFYAILLVHSALLPSLHQISSAASSAAAFEEDQNKRRAAEDNAKRITKFACEMGYNMLKHQALYEPYFNDESRKIASSIFELKPMLFIQAGINNDLLKAVDASNQTVVEAILDLPMDEFNLEIFPTILKNALDLVIEKARLRRILPVIQPANDFIAVRIMNHTCFNKINNYNCQKLLKYAINTEYSLVVKEFMKHSDFEKLFLGHLEIALEWAAKDTSESVMEKIMNHPNFNNEVKGYYLARALDFAINSTGNEKIIKMILDHQKSKEISFEDLDSALKYAKQKNKTECADLVENYMLVKHTPYQAASAASAASTGVAAVFKEDTESSAGLGFEETLCKIC